MFVYECVSFVFEWAFERVWKMKINAFGHNCVSLIVFIIWCTIFISPIVYGVCVRYNMFDIICAAYRRDVYNSNWAQETISNDHINVEREVETRRAVCILADFDKTHIVYATCEHEPIAHDIVECGGLFFSGRILYARFSATQNSSPILICFLVMYVFVLDDAIFFRSTVFLYIWQNSAWIEKCR